MPESAYPEPSAKTGFAGNPLDRLSERRDDPAFVESLRHDPTTRLILFQRDIPVLQKAGPEHTAFFTFGDAARLGDPRDLALLGRTETGAVFAARLDTDAMIEEGGTIVTIDLRSLALQGLLPAPQIGMLAQAKSLMHWHARHRFCANCGHVTELASAGWRRHCTACGADHFPRTDPVVIMLALDGDNCLLGRQGRFGKGMYSALAGYLEPGETIEAAVRREIREEAAITIGRVTYVASQPWPFPSTLMIGCFAEALSRDIVPDLVELEDARWFTRDAVLQMLAGSHPEGFTPPMPHAIANTLLRAWIDGSGPALPF